MTAPEVVTLGCRLNLAESERIAALLGGEDCIVVNTCAVTAEAMRQSRRALRQARSWRPGARLIATGCASEIDRAGFGRLADTLVPNASKLDPASWAPAFPSRLKEGAGVAPDCQAPPSRRHAHPLPLPHAGGGTNHTRAFVPVQNGCDHACTFCVIPQGRGASRSRPSAEVVAEIAGLVAPGVAEVVLTGIDLTAWGLDLPGSPRLGALVAAILAGCPALPRLRLSSLDGVEIDAELFELITGEPRVMPHVHLSLQSGDELVLKRMKRRHRPAEAVTLVERLRAARPEIAIGADFIAGFPTEDDSMHRRSLAALDACDVVHGHVFPFSPRPGTPAARMPAVAPSRVRARAAELRARLAERRERWLASLVGSRHQVLAERDGTGRAGNFARFRLPATVAAGELVTLVAARVENGLLVGSPE